MIKLWNLKWEGYSGLTTRVIRGIQEHQILRRRWNNGSRGQRKREGFEKEDYTDGLTMEKEAMGKEFRRPLEAGKVTETDSSRRNAALPFKTSHL